MRRDFIRKRLLKQKAFECLEDGGFPNLFFFSKLGHFGGRLDPRMKFKPKKAKAQLHPMVKTAIF